MVIVFDNAGNYSRQIGQIGRVLEEYTVATD
ncbi:MAG: hypothetical protein LBS09_08660 [Bacteroidales bacterium]|nr:hypothetical protein [Bacteroidales bacterium]